MRKIVIKFDEQDYQDFARISNEYGLSVEEKLREIIDVYLIIQKKQFKTSRINDF